MNPENDTIEYDFGYDPTLNEPIEITPPDPVVALPPRARVNAKYLPPVGHQYTPNCAAWASTYGLATFTAAKAGDYRPNEPSLQASPAYIYIGVLEQGKVGSNTCHGSQLKSYFDILAGGGTPTMAQAPYVPGAQGGSAAEQASSNPYCTALWKAYGSQNLPPDPAFAVKPIAAVSAKVTDQIKQILASGRALAYGTSLYTDFFRYQGDPVPYVGNGQIYINRKTNKPGGHAMLIVGYDDTCGQGAFYIQNSKGTDWGSDGFIWITYETFTTLAQGVAFYVKD